LEQVGQPSWSHTACPPPEKVARLDRSPWPASFKQWHAVEMPSKATPPLWWFCVEKGGLANLAWPDRFPSWMRLPITLYFLEPI